MATDRKNCPFCYEEIHVKAIKCKHCGSMLDGAGSEPNREEEVSPAKPAPKPTSKIVEPTDRVAQLRERANTASSDSDRIAALEQLAQHLVAEGNQSAEAVAVYEQILGIDPKRPGIFGKVQVLYIQSEDFEGLTDSLERELDYKDSAVEKVDLRLRLAFLLSEKLSAYERAAEHLAEILREYPNESNARDLLERVMEAWDRPSTTAVHARAEILIAQEDWSELADLYHKQEENAESPEEKKAALEKVYVVYSEYSRNEEAAYATCKQLVTIDPTDRRALKGLVSHAVQLDRVKNLLRFLEAAVDAEADALGERSRQLVKVLEKTFGHLGNQDGFIEFLTARAAKAAATNAKEYWLERAYAIRTEKEQDEVSAYAICKELVATDPANEEYRRKLVGHAGKLGRAANLAEFLQALMKSGAIADGALVQTYAGLIEDVLIEGGDWSLLVEHYETRVEAAPTPAAKQEWLEKIYEVRKDRQSNEPGAYAACKKLFALDPGNNSWRQQLVTHARSLKRAENLIEFLQTMAKVDGIAESEARHLRSLTDEVLVEFEKWDDLVANYLKDVAECASDSEKTKWLKKVYEIVAVRQNNEVRAYETCKELLKLDPADGEAKKLLFTHAMSLNKADDLAQFVGQVAKENPQVGHSLMADFRAAEEENLAAGQDWDQLLKLYRKNAQDAASTGERLKWTEKSYLLLTKNAPDQRKAYETCKQLVALSPKDSKWKELLLKHAAELGSGEDVKGFLNSLLNADGVRGTDQEEEYLSFYEKALERLEDWEGLVDYYRERASTATTSTDRICWLEKIYGTRLQLEGNKSAAYAVWKEIVAVAPGDVSRLELLFNQAVELGTLEDAVGFVEKIRKSPPAFGTPKAAELFSFLVATLTRLTEWHKLAALYLLQAEGAEDLHSRTEWTEKAYKVMASDAADAGSAWTLCKNLVEMDPANADRHELLLAQASAQNRLDDLEQFLNGLRQSESVAGTQLASDLLELHKRALVVSGNQGRLVELLRSKVEKCHDTAEKGALLVEILGVQTDDLQDQDAAYLTAKELVSLNPAGNEARNLVVSLATALDCRQDLLDFLFKEVVPGLIAGTKLEVDFQSFLEATLLDFKEWEHVIAMHEERVSRADSLDDKIIWLAKIYDVRAQHEKNEAAAYGQCKRIVECNPADEARREQLVNHAVRLGRLDDLANFLEQLRKSPPVAGTSQADELSTYLVDNLSRLGEWRKLADLYGDWAVEAEDSDKELQWTTKAYQLLVKEGDDSAAVYSACKKLVSLAPDNEEMRELLLAHAAEAGLLRDLNQFIEALLESDIVARTGLRTAFLGLMEKAIVKSGDVGQLVDFHRSVAGQATSSTERRGRLEQILRLQVEELDDQGEAYNTAKEIVSLAPEDRQKRESLVAFASALGRQQDLVDFLLVGASSSLVAGTELEPEFREFLESTLIDFGEWDRVAGLYEEKVQAAQSVAEKVAWLEKLFDIRAHLEKNDARAFTPGKKLLLMRPDNEKHRQELISLAVRLGRTGNLVDLIRETCKSNSVVGTAHEEKFRTLLTRTLTELGEWDILSDYYRETAACQDSLQDKLIWLEKRHEVHTQFRPDPVRAFDVCREIVTLAPSSETWVDELGRHAESLGRKRDYLAVVESAISEVAGTEWEDGLKVRREKLLAELEDWNALAISYGERLERATSDEERARWLEAQYAIYTESLKDPARAYEAARQLVALKPDRKDYRELLLAHALGAGQKTGLFEFLEDTARSDSVAGTPLESEYRTLLNEVARDLQDWDRLADVHAGEAERAKTPEERARHLEKVLEIRAGEQREWPEAFTVARELVTIDPANRSYRDSLISAGIAARLLEELVAFVEAAVDGKDISGTQTASDFLRELEEALQDVGCWQVLAEFCSRRQEQAAAVADRIHWLTKLSGFQSEKLDAPTAAFQTQKKLLALEPEGVARREQLVADAIRLDLLEEAVETLEQIWAADTVAGTNLEWEYCFQIAQLLEQGASRTADAADYYAQIVESDHSELAGRAVERLKELYPAQRRWKDYVGLLEHLGSGHGVDDEVRRDLLLEAAQVCVRDLDAPERAYETLRTLASDFPMNADVQRAFEALLVDLGRAEEFEAVLRSRIELLEKQPREQETVRLRLAEAILANPGRASEAAELLAAGLEKATQPTPLWEQLETLSASDILKAEERLNVLKSLEANCPDGVAPARLKRVSQLRRELEIPEDGADSADSKPAVAGVSSPDDEDEPVTVVGLPPSPATHGKTGETSKPEVEPPPPPQPSTPTPVKTVPPPLTNQVAPQPKTASPPPLPAETSPQPKGTSPQPKEASSQPEKTSPQPKETSPQPKETSPPPLPEKSAHKEKKKKKKKKKKKTAPPPSPSVRSEPATAILGTGEVQLLDRTEQPPPDLKPEQIGAEEAVATVDSQQKEVGPAGTLRAPSDEPSTEEERNAAEEPEQLLDDATIVAPPSEPRPGLLKQPAMWGLTAVAIAGVAYCAIQFGMFGLGGGESVKIPAPPAKVAKQTDGVERDQLLAKATISNDDHLSSPKDSEEGVGSGDDGGNGLPTPEGAPGRAVLSSESADSGSVEPAGVAAPPPAQHAARPRSRR